jgi:hypothetical protein
MLITSDNDLVKDGMYRTADILGSKATLITLKDAVLDLSLKNTHATTSWSPCLLLGCCPLSPFFGLKRHFALAGEEQDVSARPASLFLKQVFLLNKAWPEIQVSQDMHALNQQASGACCVPFPLFVSCCEM